MSASALHLKVKHNRQVRQIALYNGLTAEELSSILQAVFALHANSVVVGLLSPQVRQAARVCVFPYGACFRVVWGLTPFSAI
jgi:hypothetical protein